LHSLADKKLSATQRSAKARKLKEFVRGWTSAFGLCVGMKETRILWISKIETAAATGFKKMAFKEAA
jgi:hypothetical protein